MTLATITEYLTVWLREQVQAAGMQGVVLGVSGGVDSAVAAVLAKKAFPDTCHGLIMPCYSREQDTLDARRLMEKFAVRYDIVSLDEAYSLLHKQLNGHFNLRGRQSDLINGNLRPRLRMLTLYFFAQAQNYLVLGTDNKSEMLLGYSTKYGDNGVDLQLLGDLTKTEIYALAHYLGIPDDIIKKPPSAGLWPGQSDETELGFTYKQLDHYIQTGEADAIIKQRIEELHRRSEHKRRLPPMPKLDKNDHSTFT